MFLWMLFVGIPAGAEPLTLDRAIELSLERNERAKQAALGVVAAEATVARARAAFLPDLGVSGSYTLRAFESARVDDAGAPVQGHHALSAGALLSVMLLDLRAFPLLRQAEHQEEAARLGALEERRQLMFDTATRFVAVLGFEQVALASKRRLELARLQLRDARARFSAGLVSANDVTRAELEVATAELEDTRAKNNVVLAYEALSSLIDLPIEAGLAPPEALAMRARQRPPPVDTLIDEAKQRRLDVKKLSEDSLALQASANEPSTRIFPRLGLSGQYRISNEGGFAGRNDDLLGVVQLTWEVWDGGERSAEAAGRDALAQIAASKVSAAERQLELEVRSALVNLELGHAAVSQSVIAVQLAERNAAETAELYRQGLSTALAVSDAALRRFEAEVGQARQQLTLTLAFLELRSAIGATPIETTQPSEAPK
ncbi:MAG: TolC family protein [Deltaproteobacteria bacterium]|nr:TolC family protein [Deltaproteobacteria bacterium]